MNHLELIIAVAGAAFVFHSCWKETMRHAKPATRTGKRKATSKPPATVLAMPLPGAKGKVPPSPRTY